MLFQARSAHRQFLSRVVTAVTALAWRSLHAKASRMLRLTQELVAGRVISQVRLRASNRFELVN